MEIINQPLINEIEEMILQFLKLKGFNCNIKIQQNYHHIEFLENEIIYSIPINDILENYFFSIWCDITKLNSFEEKRLSIIIANNVNLDYLSGKIVIQQCGDTQGWVVANTGTYMLKYDELNIYFDILLTELKEMQKRFLRFFNDISWHNEEVFIHR